VRLVVARPKLYMRKYGRRMGVGERIGQENIFYSVHDAVASIVQRDAAGVDSA